MKRLILFSALLAGLTLCTACSVDVNLSLEMTANDWEQTTWSAREVAYDGQGNVVGERFYILEFQTKTDGKCTEQDANGDYLRTDPFSYTVNSRLIGFQGALTLKLTITERTKQQIVMQAFNENKFVMTLTRMY